MNDWDLLSPRYFSDIFVSLFNGGPLVFMAIFFLLFFGSLILPMIVQTWRKWGAPATRRALAGDFYRFRRRLPSFMRTSEGTRSIGATQYFTFCRSD